ncbi:hypothetical protein pdam_00008083 [Pocillopora damicornis]|uniref:L1 transposable element RRM domain-containing protein n=1 Tax=Pocillopora damicornis TaxID=46731 RepID=A0A3M6TEA8_POCDA|nr:hypothetical protein pdam_00008083 [Pocillopora damicornis]
MPDTEAKLDAVLAKMDELLAAKDEQESKLNAILIKLESLEKSQKKTAQDVDELKDSYKLLDHDVTERRRTAKKIDALNEKIEDLENRSKRNNVVIWGLKEGAEKDCSSVEEFLEEELFSKHMGLDNIEVMRAHRTKINQAAASATAPQSRPIHVYLLRYPDKGRILKAAANTLKDNPFCDSQIFISDDVSKSVRSERAKLRKDHLKQLKEREGVQFAFIPWSVPAQILYKEIDSEGLKSFKIRHE